MVLYWSAAPPCHSWEKLESLDSRLLAWSCRLLAVASQVPAAVRALAGSPA
jgi:hypothetical protein